MSRERCESCVGIRKELCSEAFRQESQLVTTLRKYDELNDRAQELATNLGGIGCTLSSDEVKEKVITRIAG